MAITFKNVKLTDKGPAGAVARMLQAQATNDRALLEANVTPETMQMPSTGLPPDDITVTVQSVAKEKDTATVTAQISSADQSQDLPLIVVRQKRTWRVDMAATIDKMMGGAVQEVASTLQDGMEQMAQGMSAAMQGVAQGLAGTLDDSVTTNDADDTATTGDPALAHLQRELRDFADVDWRLQADWLSFELAEQRNNLSPDGRVPFLGTVCSDIVSALIALREDAADLAPALRQIATVRFNCATNPGAQRYLDLSNGTLFYSLGESPEGQPVHYDQHDFATALRPFLSQLT